MANMESSTATRTRARSHSVRFEDSCVLIPPSELSKSTLPRIFTKSYSLPLWRPTTTPPKKPAPAISSPTDPDAVDKKPFSLSVLVPSLTTKPRHRRPSLPPSPCLSKRSSTGISSSVSSSILADSDSSSPCALVRPPTFPPIQPAVFRDAAMIPLRPCCEDCYNSVDTAFAKGEHWAEKWSTGARRRYSEGEHAQLHVYPLFGYSREWKPTGPDVPLAAALKVDEVEVKRRSDSQNAACIDENAFEDSDEESPRRPAHSEEEEDLLFPLSTSRRSPSSSPPSTPLSTSQSSLSAMQTSQEIAPILTESPVPMHPRSSSLPALMIPESSSFHNDPASDLSPDDSLPVATPNDTSGSQIESPVHLRQGSVSSPVSRRRQPSFNSASSIIKGSASMLKGLAAGMTSAGSVAMVR